MAESLTFLMGKHEAVLPGDRWYARNHMWALPVEQGRLRFGFSAYAIRLMRDVYFLDWCVDVGASVAFKQQIGNVETSKAVSDLFAPVAGVMVALNPSVLQDPSAINVDGNGAGWLFEMTAPADGLMDAQAYFDSLGPTWESTQRILKGQVNAG